MSTLKNTHWEAIIFSEYSSKSLESDSESIETNLTKTRFFIESLRRACYKN
jgi:hypothetical protein